MINAAGSVGRHLLEVQEQLACASDEKRALAATVQSLRVALANNGNRYKNLIETAD